MDAPREDASVGCSERLPLQLPSPTPGHYSVHGGPPLDELIDQTLAAVTLDLRAALGDDCLDGLVLGGGYGRGEGGVLLVDGEPRLFNDLDLVLVHHHPDQAAARRVAAEVGHAHGTRAGVHVDVTPLHRDRLERLPPALTWYELARGHRVAWGRPDVLAPLAGRRLGEVHAAEWGRLLTNRALGVALSRRLRAGEACPALDGERPEAVETRHIQKAWLALGDVWLADHGAYSDRVLQRAASFERLVDARSAPESPLSERYPAAIRFKLLPSLHETSDAPAQLEELSLILARELLVRRASPPRPLVGLVTTVRLVPPNCWLRSAPWRYPRERLRLALAAELEGDLRRRDALCGSAEGLVDMWQAYG